MRSCSLHPPGRVGGSTCCPHPQPPPSQGAARQPHGPLVWEERLLGSGWAVCVCVCVCVRAHARLRSRVPSCPAPPADSSPLVCSGGVTVASVPRAPCGLGPLSRVVPAAGLRSEEHQPRPLRPALTPGSSSPTGPLGAALTVLDVRQRPPSSRAPTAARVVALSLEQVEGGQTLMVAVSVHACQQHWPQNTGFVSWPCLAMCI